jgi:hypothetical protein
MILEHLDTLIAFVVILAGVSLLVTVFTQIVSAFLGLRGTNLRWGIETLLKEVDPSLKAYAKTIAEHVLHRLLNSDSALSRMGFRVLAKICDANTRLDDYFLRRDCFRVAFGCHKAPRAAFDGRRNALVIGHECGRTGRQGQRGSFAFD